MIASQSCHNFKDIINDKLIKTDVFPKLTIKVSIQEI